MSTRGAWVPGGALVALVVAYAMTGACEPVPLGDGPRRAAIKALANDVMLPAVEVLEVEAHALAAAVEEAAADPTKLETARMVWRRARSAYKRVEPVGLGPLVTLRLGARLDQSPVDPERIFELVRTATLTPEAIAELGANRLGFHALEALLFGAEIEAAWARDARTGRLAAAIAAVLAVDATRLRRAWDEDYARQLGDIGAADAAFDTAAAAVDALVNVLIAHAERMLVSRLGKPLGHDSGGLPAPELVESPLADGAVDDLLDNLQGIEHAYEVGLSPVVVARSPALDRRVRDAIAAARVQLAAIPRPFAAAVADRAPEAAAAYDAVSALWVLLRTEVVGTLGAALKLNDNDGD